MRSTSWLAAVLGIASAAFIPRQTPEWTARRPLPKPAGPYAIGTATLSMSDTARFHDGRAIPRPVTLQVWYPARSGGPTSRYADPVLVDSMIGQKYLDLGPADLKPLAEVRLAAVVDAAPLAPPRASGWPVLAFSHGFGMSRVSYAALIQELVSRGYVVISFDHPYGGFTLAPDGRVLQPGGDSLRRRLGSDAAPASVDSALAWATRRWAAEAGRGVRLVFREAQRAGTAKGPRLDTLRVGMLGHSLGGAAALQGCRDDAMFKACADFDGEATADVSEHGVPRPMLVLLSQPGGPKREPKDSAEREHQAMFARMGRERDSTWNAIRARHASIPAFVVKLRGTAHMSFSDAPFLMPTQMQGTGSTLSADRAEQLIVERVVDFFGHYLRGEPLRVLKR